MSSFTHTTAETGIGRKNSVLYNVMAAVVFESKPVVMAKQFIDYLRILPNIGVNPHDEEGLKLRKRFLNSMALLMSTGGLLWGGIALYFHLIIPALLPFAYTALTGANLWLFHLTRRFQLVGFIQILLSLLLPFVFQWSLGGLINSGGMMLWSFLALVGAMSFQNLRQSIGWLVVFLLFTVASGLLDRWSYPGTPEFSQPIIITFFILNVATISSIIFGLMLYFINSRDKANQQLQQLTNTLEEKVDQRTRELQDSNEELNALNNELHTTLEQVQTQNQLIEVKNKSITDSINYARRIQHAILQSNEDVCQKMDEHFIFFRPRDIVSGDFYWFHCDNQSKKQFVAVVDCTGHGVPGAFMSLIADSLLKKLIVDQKISDPKVILEGLHEGVAQALHINNSNRHDGMDMALTIIDKHNGQVEFAGAKSPLVWRSNGQIHVIKGDARAIGGQSRRKQKTFTRHQVALNGSTQLYMYSDGFPDQFGGPHGRKYLSTRFRDFLAGISHLPMHEQGKALEKEFVQWKGKHRQTDDVLVVGLKINTHSHSA